MIVFAFCVVSCFAVKERVTVNHYKIDGPAVISFSGGATSGFMLNQILAAHGGELPNDVVVCFANTGLEHLKTLDFVNKAETNWGIKIHWLEYRSVRNFVQVDFQSASRKGEPFDLLINDKQYLPNPAARFCTIEMKIKTISRFVREVFGFSDGYSDIMGLRYDEPSRVARTKNSLNSDREVCCPMYYAKHTLDDVEKFWNQNSFKLEIPRILSNCVGCFLKGASKLDLIARESPGSLEWWADREERPFGITDDGIEKRGVFRSDRPRYRNLIRMVDEQKLFDFPDDESMPCNCTD